MACSSRQFQGETHEEVADISSGVVRSKCAELKHQAAESLERVQKVAPTEKRCQTAMSLKLAEGCSVHSPTRSHTLSPYSDIEDSMKDRGSKAKLSSRRKKNVANPLRGERSLILHLLSDTRRLLWLVSTWTLASYKINIVDKMRPVYFTSWLGQRLSWCHHLSTRERVDMAKLPTPQQHFEYMIDSANQNLGLAVRMLGNEYSAKDLKIRHEFS